jgi:bisphosphoglycerate-independent phosphoglycerate mutase (AlkP superfamily)
MNNPVPARATGRTKRLLILIASLALFAAACSKADNANNANSTAPANKNSTATVSNTSTTSTAPAVSPVNAYKAFQEANRNKDYEAVKKSFSKGSLAMIVEEAKKKNQTLDEYVKAQVDRSKSDEVVGNEKITGETASIELKDKDGTSSITLPMVVEDGAWKIAYDKFMKQMEEEFDKMSKEAQKSADNANSSSGSDNANK